jgi:hypothetical protein
MKGIAPTLLMVIALQVQAAHPPEACSDMEAAHALDFWLGSWDVLDREGDLLGHNRIESVVGGCAIVEEWTGAQGFEGRSLFYFHSWLGQWRQIWITSAPQRPGSVKEKRLAERFSDGGVRFRGEIMISPEHYVQDRTTLRPLPDGRVHQLIEWSNDDGKTWNRSFEGWYVASEPQK